jgi:hypothetical protein
MPVTSPVTIAFAPFGRLLCAALSISIVPSLAHAATGTLPSDKYEQPRHAVIEKIDNIEIRRYEPMLMAEVDVEGDRSTAANRGFRILADYIFGNNVKRESISMTSPVTQEASAPKTNQTIAMTSPVTQSATATSTDGEGIRWTVGFMMPSSFTLDTLPKAKTDRIRFRMSEPVTRATIRFSGISSVSNLEKHREALLTFVKSRGITVVGEPVVAFYDDPFTLPWNRRNEWWVAINMPAAPPTAATKAASPDTTR